MQATFLLFLLNVRKRTRNGETRRKLLLLLLRRGESIESTKKLLFLISRERKREREFLGEVYARTKTSRRDKEKRANPFFVRDTPFRRLVAAPPRAFCPFEAGHFGRGEFALRSVFSRRLNESSTTRGNFTDRLFNIYILVCPAATAATKFFIVEE